MMYYKYSKEDEETVLHIAKEINKTLPAIFSKEREVLTLDYMLGLVQACETVLEEHGHDIVPVARHNYTYKDDTKILKAVSFMVAEAVVHANRAGYSFKQLNGEYLNYNLRGDWLDSEMKELRTGVAACKKNSEMQLNSIFAVFEKGRQRLSYVCLCGKEADENIFLLSQKQPLKLNEYEFYASDAEKSKKKLEKYFKSIG